jgi:hypothetical protein
LTARVRDEQTLGVVVGVLSQGPPSYAIEKVAVVLLVCPCHAHVTVAVPPVPRDSMCQVHPTTPLHPTVCADVRRGCDWIL